VHGVDGELLEWSRRPGRPAYPARTGRDGSADTSHTCGRPPGSPCLLRKESAPACERCSPSTKAEIVAFDYDVLNRRAVVSRRQRLAVAGPNFVPASSGSEVSSRRLRL
jgi:hypothetical protein